MNILIRTAHSVTAEFPISPIRDPHIIDYQNIMILFPRRGMISVDFNYNLNRVVMLLHLKK